MFIQTEVTPNPATLKFLPGKTVLESGSADFRAGDDTSVSPLATKLFEIPGVTGVFFGYDFVTITKDDNDADGFDWAHLKPAVLGAIMEHFMAGHPVMVENGVAPESGEEFFEESDTQIVNTIKELLDTRVRPAVAQDGGDITFRGFREKLFAKSRRNYSGANLLHDLTK